MAFIKEESEDMRIEEDFRVKQEDAEEQAGWFLFLKLNLIIFFLIEMFHISEINYIFENDCMSMLW